MGDFKKNPKQPFEVRVPNKIRKRIAMHEKHSPEPNIISPMIKLFRKPEEPKRGSLWSRFTGWVKGGCV